MPRILNYMPRGLSHRLPMWIACSPLALLAIAGLALEYFDPDFARQIRFILSGIIALLISVFIYAIFSGQSWKLQIDGQTLAFRRPYDLGWATCNINNIQAIWELKIQDTHFFEMQFSDGRAILVAPISFAPFRKTRKRLLDVNPAIQFSQREAYKCIVCYRDRARHMQDRCPDCDAPVSRELPQIKAPGVILPDAIDTH